LLDPEELSPGARRARALELALILLGLAALTASTVETLSPATHLAARLVTAVAAIAFTATYLIRLFIVPDIPHHSAATPATARLRWATSVAGLTQLAAIVPVFSLFWGGKAIPPGWAAVFVLLWVAKLIAHTPGLALLVRVVRNERSPLTTVVLLIVIVLLAAAAIAHSFEGRAQPDTFGSIPKALWWAMGTLTTTGYGDAVPQTLAGRVLAGLLMLCGFSVLALLAGILANGFSEEVKRIEFLRIWGLVARVPFFSEVGALAMLDIVGRLRSRDLPAGAAVIRRGGVGDNMYFIVSGEVAVGRGSVRLGAGDFFGEMALLDRRPRVADVVTTRPSVLLVLSAADFYQLAGQHRTLVDAIEAEANRRRAENEAHP
jgi:voltage-gated potassium channel